MSDEAVKPPEQVVLPKRRGGRPFGSVEKKKVRLKDSAELRTHLFASLTPKDIDALSPELRARLAASMIPKEAPAASSASFTLAVRGLPGWSCFHCGKPQPRDYRAPEAAVPAAVNPSPRDAPKPFIGESSEELYDCGGNVGEVET
jgi:hypothetical protein